MSDPPTSETKPPIANPPIAIGKAGSRRRRGLLWLTSVVIVAGAAYGSWWFLYGRYYESTDDSYVNGDLVQITSEVPGTVIKVAVDDTQSVRRGQPLIELDPADAQVAMDSAKADLARAVRRVRTLFAQAEELRAQIAEREIALKRAEDDYARRAQLAGDGAVSEEELSHTKDAIIQLQASLTAAREQLAATTAQIDGTTIRTHPDVLSASAMLRNASLALSRTDIVASVAGVVAWRTVEVGQQVAAGSSCSSGPCKNIVAYVAQNANARYVVAGLGALSDAGRNTFPLGRINNFDASLLKRISITERFRMDFGIQTFNVFNHSQFTGGRISDVNFYNTASISRSFLIPNNAQFGQYNLFLPSNSREVQLVAHFIF